MNLLGTSDYFNFGYASTILVSQGTCTHQAWTVSRLGGIDGRFCITKTYLSLACKCCFDALLYKTVLMRLLVCKINFTDALVDMLINSSVNTAKIRQATSPDLQGSLCDLYTYKYNRKQLNQLIFDR